MSIAELRRIIELEERAVAAEKRLAEVEKALHSVVTMLTELEVRLETPRPQVRRA
jgi:uncharacterized coiled-coil protein SlyX